MSNKRGRADIRSYHEPLSVFDRMGQPKHLYAENNQGSEGGDRLYTLNLHHEHTGAKDIDVTWDLGAAPKPHTGRSHKALLSVTHFSLVNKTATVFAADTSYILCLDAPAPQNYSATTKKSGSRAAGEPLTLERPSTFYEYTCVTAATSLTLSDLNSPVTSYMTFYPLPKLRFTMRNAISPNPIVVSTGTDKTCIIQMRINVQLLD